MVSEVSRTIRRALDARVSAEVAPELGGIQGMVLGRIVAANREDCDIYQRDIEKWLHIQRSSVTSMLQNMEQAGLITRSAVQKDARLKRLQATPKGVAYHDRVHNTIDRYETELQAGLSQQELETMCRGLNILLRNAQVILDSSAEIRKEQ